MKTIIILITLVIATTATSCKKDTTTICENLLEQGSADISFLEGEWEFEYFAYTANGNKIKNKDEIQKGELHISDTSMDTLNMGMAHTNTVGFLYELDGANSITINMQGSTYITPPQEEIDITFALINSRCYVIKDNELLFHYKEDDYGNNILILKRK